MRQNRQLKIRQIRQLKIRQISKIQKKKLLKVPLFQRFRRPQVLKMKNVELNWFIWIMSHDSKVWGALFLIVKLGHLKPSISWLNIVKNSTNRRNSSANFVVFIYKVQKINLSIKVWYLYLSRDVKTKVKFTLEMN